MALEKLQLELKNLGKNQSGSDAENAKLKDELTSVKKKLSDTEMQLDIIQEQIASKVEEMLRIEKEKVTAVEKMHKMEQEVKEMREAEDVINQQLDQSQKKLRAEKVENEKLAKIVSNIQSLYEKMKVGMQPIEQTLSCLSCLEYLSEPNPLTLICGHSICGKVSIKNYSFNIFESFFFSASINIATRTARTRLSFARSVRLNRKIVSYATAKL